MVAREKNRVGVDVGGTFTDIVSLNVDGEVTVGKVRSAPGGVSAELWESLDRMHAGESSGDAGRLLVHGTTVATNALLERTGGRVLLVTTAGFEDLLWLRRQDRADLYDLAKHHPTPLVAREDVIGVAERAGPRGVSLPLEPDEIQRVVESAVSSDADAIVVSFLFSFRFPEHERQMADALRSAMPETPIAGSHEVLPVFREYERISTAVAEAYLRPKVSGYIERMGKDAALHGMDGFRVMASNGGTMGVAHARERVAALALSGPAGGVEGARLVGATVGDEDLLTLDMGGTSADASVIIAGAPLVQTAASVGGVTMSLPHVLIETVGAGGGSIAWVDRGGALRVGPRSAGAKPGPAAYGQGGKDATVTDAAAVLGWLGSDHPLAGSLVLDVESARAAVGEVVKAAGLSIERCADGIIEIATAAMVRALRTVSVERGVDPRLMTLVAFGGAGPLFACRMADSLGMKKAMVPPHAGVLSALGLAAAPEKLEFVVSLHKLTHELGAEDMNAACSELERASDEELPGAERQRFADCRYVGQGYELTVPAVLAGEQVAAEFHNTHERRFGHCDTARAVEVVNVRVVATRGGTTIRLGGNVGKGALLAGATRADWHSLAPGTTLEGPLMVDGLDSTVRIEAGWHGVVHPSGAILLERK
jgi:N-methylhydantoinase A